VGLESAQEFDLKTANAVAMAKSKAPGLFEGVTNSADGAAFGDSQERTGDGGEEMRVLVGVEVRDVDARALELLHLGDGLAFDIVFADGAAEEGLNEVEKRGAKAFAVGAEERGDGLRRRGGNPVGKDDVAAYAEGRIGVGDGDGIVECSASGHQGSGGERVGVVKLCDGAVDAWGEAEVVRVDDESGSHRVYGNAYGESNTHP
jgi:hypothetical protein